MIDYNMDIQDAIDCARIYDNASENICYGSGGVNPILLRLLKNCRIADMKLPIRENGSCSSAVYRNLDR